MTFRDSSLSTQRMKSFAIDSVKKWQFEYNRSTCFSNNYPEMNYKEENEDRVSVAPGEGKCPTNIL